MAEENGNKIDSKESDEKIESEIEQNETEQKEVNEQEKDLEARLRTLENDLKNRSDEEKARYIIDLRNEAKENRIKKEKLKSEQEKLQNKLKDKSKSLSELEKKLKAYEQAEKDKELADASEIEKLNAKLTDYEKLLTEKEEILKQKIEETIQLNRMQKINERESFIDRLMSKQGGQFSSEWERSGFINEFLGLDSELEFEKPDEEVALEVDKFLMGKRKEEVKETVDFNKAGPKKKMSTKPLMDEINFLKNKPDLTTDEMVRLAEISMQLGE